MKIEKNINFHQTFPPTPAYIGRILSIANGESRTPREISDLTGIPQGESSGKVVPHLKYAYYMGLIEADVSRPTLTTLGETVLTEDKSCGEALTQWLMHRSLISAAGAPMWNYLYRDLLHNNNGSVNKEYLSRQMEMRFGKCKYTPALTTYNEFSAIDYISVSTDSVSIRHQSLNRELLYVYAYELLAEWENIYPDHAEITADECYRMASSTCFGLSEIQWFEAMEQIAGKGICRLNRQLSPFTVIRLAESSAVIPKLYSLLL